MGFVEVFVLVAVGWWRREAEMVEVVGAVGHRLGFGLSRRALVGVEERFQGWKCSRRGY